MNYVYLLIEIILVFLLLLIFYKYGKKEGLFLYIGFLSSLISTLVFKSIDVFSFEVSLSIPAIVGIFVSCNIIVQRYGIDEVKDIIKSFAFPFLISAVILSLVTLTVPSDYNLTANNYYNALFGYSLDNLRLIVGTFLSISFGLWYNSHIYYYIRKNKNKHVISYIGSMLIIQFAESLMFIVVTYVGSFGFDMLFGMIVISYLLKIIMGFIGLLPFVAVLKMKS